MNAGLVHDLIEKIPADDEHYFLPFEVAGGRLFVDGACYDDAEDLQKIHAFALYGLMLLWLQDRWSAREDFNRIGDRDGNFWISVYRREGRPARYRADARSRTQAAFEACLLELDPDQWTEVED